MRRIFWGFCRNWFLIDPLHYLSSRSVFGFEFAEIFIIEKRLPDSASREVANSLSRQVGESSTPRLAESGSRYGDSGNHYSNFLKFHHFKQLKVHMNAAESICCPTLKGRWQNFGVSVVM